MNRSFNRPAPTSLSRMVLCGFLLMLLLQVCVYSAESPITVVSVKDFGAAGDGSTDDTAAFEKAIIKAKESGLSVRVPTGRYRVTKTLTLKAITMTGADNAAWVADAVTMPTILPEVKDGPCIRLEAGGAVHGLHFFYDWKGQTASPKPAAVMLSGVGCRVSEVKIHGAWDGIMADGKNNVGRAIIEKCFLVDIHHVGVRMTGTWDVTWISKVEVWSPASKTFPESGVGFQFGKNDVLLVSDCFAFRAQIGYQIVDEIPGCEIKGVTWGSISNCSSDYCSFAMQVKGAHTISVVGGTYWTHFGGLTVSGTGGQVRLSGLEMAANGGPALTIEGGEVVTLSSCQLRRKHKSFDVPAVRVTGGESTVITGCVISSSSKGIEVKKDLDNVVLANNIVKENQAVQ